MSVPGTLQLDVGIVLPAQPFFFFMLFFSFRGFVKFVGRISGMCMRYSGMLGVALKIVNIGTDRDAWGTELTKLTRLNDVDWVCFRQHELA